MFSPFYHILDVVCVLDLLGKYHNTTITTEYFDIRKSVLTDECTFISYLRSFRLFKAVEVMRPRVRVIWTHFSLVAIR